MGGYLAEHYGWRTTFVVIGLAGVLTSLLVLLTLREPKRGALDPAQLAEGPPPSAFAVAKFLFAKPAMRQTMLAGALAGISMNAIGQFLNPFLARNFLLGPAEVGRLLGLIAGVSMASGPAAGRLRGRLGLALRPTLVGVGLPPWDCCWRHRCSSSASRATACTRP